MVRGLKIALIKHGLDHYLLNCGEMRTSSKSLSAYSYKHHSAFQNNFWEKAVGQKKMLEGGGVQQSSVEQ